MFKFLKSAAMLLCIATTSLTATAQSPASAERVKVRMETSLGTVMVELYNETPKHRDNFVKLVRSGFYNGLLFHRVINGFMVQAGDPNSRNAAQGAHLGDGDPGYYVEAEILFPQFYHKRGALAAAREGDDTNPERRSSGSQFYIVTGHPYTSAKLNSIEISTSEAIQRSLYNKLVEQYSDTIKAYRKAGNTAAINKLDERLYDLSAEQTFSFPSNIAQVYKTTGGAPNLDGLYTVFGEVVEGMDVIDQIQQLPTDGYDRPTQDVAIIKAEVVPEVAD